MKYFLPIQRRYPYPTKTDGSYYRYSYYRLHIAEDCKFRCGYCDCHQDEIGGLLAMETDHFRPWNKTIKGNKPFANLVDDPTNLVHSCGVCNGFKLGYWPSEDPNIEYDHEKGWIDPFSNERNNFFSIDSEGTIMPLRPPADYMIKKLRLNRPLLKKLRQLRCVWDRIESFEDELRKIVSTEQNTPHALTAKKSLDVFTILKQLTLPR